MPNFQGSVLGTLLTMLGFDGSAFRNITVDSDGHPQVDAVTAQLITGFATETTLGLVKDRIGALTSPASGSTNKLLTDMLTALQLIDDLRGALDSVDTDELVVNVDESALPTGAATETSLQGIEDMIPDQLIGYSNVYRDTDSIVNAAAGNNNIDLTAVGGGELHIITSVEGVDVDSVLAVGRLIILSGGTSYDLVREALPAVNQGIHYSGCLVLKEGEQIRYRAEGATLNDTLVAYATGWIATI